MIWDQWEGEYCLVVVSFPLEACLARAAALQSSLDEGEEEEEKMEAGAF